jgi:putative inorganic carbon (HCO3(-)) transporter
MSTPHDKPNLQYPAILSLVVVVLIGLYLIMTSAFYPLDFLPVFDAKRLLQLVLFTILLVFSVAWAPLRQNAIAQLNRLSSVNRVALTLFFIIGIVSSLRLEHPAYALVDVSMIFIMTMLIAVTAASRELAGQRFDRWAVLLLVVMGFVVALLEFMGFLAGWALGTEFSYDQALMHFAHPRFYNQLQTWSIPVLAALPLFFPGKRWIKLVCIALLGLQWFLVIALAARGTVVSLFAAMAFIALWLPGQRRFWLKYQIAGLFVGILIYSGILFLNSVLIPQSQSGEFYAHSAGRSMAHTSGRSTFWRLSVKDAIKHPVLGAGPTRFACDSKISLPAHPHNFLFRILGEWGFIALLLVLILAVTIGLGFLKALKYSINTCQSDPPLKAMLAISLIAGVIHACLSGLLIMPASQVTMILIAGWTLSLSGTSQVQPENSVTASSVLLAGMFFICATLVFATGEITQLPERASYSSHYGPMVPRFWQDGRVCEYFYTQDIANE